MNNFALPVASIATVALAGCGSLQVGSADKRPDCPGNAPAKITVTAKEARFAVAPPHLCVDAGGTIDVKIAGSPGRGDVKMRGKGLFPPRWLSGSNEKNESEFTIGAPDRGRSDPYFYNVTVEGYGTIDPMITVRE